MSSVGYSDLRDASYKALGLDPSFTDQSEIDASSLPGPPDALADGVSVSGAVVALIDLKLRSDPSKQQAWITITTVANSATYTATINGVAHNYASDASATLQEILEGVRDAINAGAQPVTAALVDLDEDGTADAVVVGSDTATGTFTIAVSATGVGAIDETHEATSVTYTVWLAGKGRSQYHQAAGWTAKTVTQNTTDRIECAGYDYAFVEITATDGTVTPAIGPGGLPS